MRQGATGVKLYLYSCTNYVLLLIFFILHVDRVVIETGGHCLHYSFYQSNYFCFCCI